MGEVKTNIDFYAAARVGNQLCGQVRFSLQAIMFLNSVSPVTKNTKQARTRGVVPDRVDILESSTSIRQQKSFLFQLVFLWIKIS